MKFLSYSPLRALSPLGVSLALLLSSCSSPKIKMQDRPVESTEAARALTNSTALAVENRDTLRAEGLLSLYRSDADGAIRSLAERHEREPTEARRRALAEMCSDSADRMTADSSDAALGHYLDAALLSEKSALAAAGQAGESPDRTLYNYAAARVARLIRSYSTDRSLNAVTAPGVFRTWHLRLATHKGAVDPRDFDIVVPASWLKTSGIKWGRVAQGGFGSAMVGHVTGTPERRAADLLMPSNGYGFPLNASLRFSGSTATLVLQNLMVSSEASVSGKRVTLAGDFSAALAFLYYERRIPSKKLGAMFRPGQFENTIATYATEPFREDKIPLILVHGLMSTAEGWLPFLNLLRADPVMREKYQVILFNYPTGNPIQRNAAELRDRLAKFRKTYDPHRRNPHMDNMVILGHSMGGILSNIQIRSSGDHLYNIVFTKNIEDLHLDSEKEEMVREVIFFKANPDIDRALLLAAPHRGSAFATNRIGQLGSWLIRMPFNLVDAVLGEISAVDALTDVAQKASQRPSNSVTSLRPDNPMLPAILDLPVRDGVKIHSIIAQRNPKDPTLEGSDGVVPYSSSHLDGVVSEKIIMEANHRSMLAKDETIREVWRILYLHAGVQRTRNP